MRPCSTQRNLKGHLSIDSLVFSQEKLQCAPMCFYNCSPHLTFTSKPSKFHLELLACGTGLTNVRLHATLHLGCQVPHADVLRVVWKCIVGVGVVMVATIVALALYTIRIAFCFSPVLFFIDSYV